jgi:hypothetical protein
MQGFAVFARPARICLLGLGLVGIPNWPAVAAEVNITHTNWADRWITNLIEVRVPTNRFVNEYHTNWVEQARKRVIDVYATNTVTRLVTNTIAINQTQTNLVQAFRTNWQTLELTIDVPVDLVRTNFVERFRTNWTVWTFTNWQTVVVFRTNWVNLPATNFVQVDAPKSVTADVADAKETKSDAAVTAVQGSAVLTDSVLLEAARTTRPAANNQVEVCLSVHGAKGATRFQVQHWRVERLDGAILVFGQEQEFKRELPVGEYKVEVKGQESEDGPLLVARGRLSLSEREAHLQQKLLVTR